MCLSRPPPQGQAPKAPRPHSGLYMAIRSDRMAGATAMRLALQLYPCNVSRPTETPGSPAERPPGYRVLKRNHPKPRTSDVHL